MELGEGATINQIADINHGDDCYFCKASDDQSTEVNDLTDDPDEDAAEMEDSLGEYRFKNDAGKLGNAMGGKPAAKSVSLGSGHYDAAVAAHHLIPGNASLKKVRKLMKFMWTDGEAKGNIGYNINARTNGVWLPGNYGVRPWGSGGVAFEANSGVSAKAFAFAAMDAWGAQFHDAHTAYSDFVAEVLDKIADKLRANEELWCPEQKKKGSDEPTQMFSIVGRLNTISARMKRMLVFPTTGWRSNIYTSRFVQQYMLEKEHQLTSTASANQG